MKGANDLEAQQTSQSGELPPVANNVVHLPVHSRRTRVLSISGGTLRQCTGGRRRSGHYVWFCHKCNDGPWSLNIPACTKQNCRHGRCNKCDKVWVDH